MKSFAFLALAVVTSAAHAVVYSNGPVTSGFNSSGAPISILQSTSLGQGTLGFGHQANLGNRVADNFSVTGGGWIVSRISFFAYQTNATAFSFTGADAQIVSGLDPNAGSSMLNLVNSPVSNGGVAGYRVTETTLDNLQRPIYRVDITGLNLNLAAGDYMMKWGLYGSLASGPWAPPVAPYSAGDGFQSLTNGAYNPALDGGTGTLRVTFPFEVEYQAVPEPGTMIAVGAGIAGLISRRRKKA